MDQTTFHTFTTFAQRAPTTNGTIDCIKRFFGMVTRINSYLCQLSYVVTALATITFDKYTACRHFVCLAREQKKDGTSLYEKPFFAETN